MLASLANASLSHPAIQGELRGYLQSQPPPSPQSSTIKQGHPVLPVYEAGERATFAPGSFLFLPGDELTIKSSSVSLSPNVVCGSAGWSTHC